MRFSVSTYAALAALASVPGTVADDGQLGFALGVKQPDGACKYQADYEADMDAIKKNANSTMVRIYDASDCDVTNQLLPAAKAKGFKAILGLWPENDSQYNAGKAAIVANAENFKDQIYAVTVGSESLYRGTYTAQQLADRVADLRKAAPQLRYGTADSWNKYADGTADALVPQLDIILINAFAYWQGGSIDNATNVLNDDFAQAKARVETARGKDAKEAEYWVGETGWPSEGTTYQNAVPSLDNAKTFYTDAVCPKVKNGTNVFVFEAFDEPWKPKSIGLDGSAADETHWGVMNADRSEKYPLEC